VADDLSSTPISEHATCQEAESAARVRAADHGGGEVIVTTDDPTGLAAVEDTEVEERTDPPGRSGASSYEPERLRGEQGSF
jgi:hypothetical protein